ncbi:MAG: ferritin-like domain-containing protein [Candidatus Rokubacteria bacterium]|nr:ferritin-like domain-containing protein [Candidatus Rokubacteria bacterium]MBI2492077.1 ferritin-like domain-containing protein [Candidatus Rokubacteria bacterium]
MATHTVPARYDTLFQHAYPVQQPELRRLYENAKRDQWNVSRDIDWTQPVDLDRGVVADELIDIYGTPFWERLDAKERAELNRRFTAWRLSVLLYGEHGAMLVCSHLVEIVAGTDAKFFQATQVVDEARHTEALDRYLTEKLGGLVYPMPPNERELFDTLLGDSRWYVKTIGLQLIAETFAVSIFRMLSETSKDPVLRQICRYVLQDESRHMGFGMLSLPGAVAEMSERERRETEEITQWALVKVLTGLFPREVYRDMGFNEAEIREIEAGRKVRAIGGESSFFRQTFKKDLHGTLVNNLAKIGLLTAGVRSHLETLGIRVPADVARAAAH